MLFPHFKRALIVNKNLKLTDIVKSVNWPKQKLTDNPLTFSLTDLTLLTDRCPTMRISLNFPEKKTHNLECVDHVNQNIN